MPGHFWRFDSGTWDRRGRVLTFGAVFGAHPVRQVHRVGHGGEQLVVVVPGPFVALHDTDKRRLTRQVMHDHIQVMPREQTGPEVFQAPIAFEQVELDSLPILLVVKEF